MREESHLDDMRAAIRGDFERLAKRRGEQELMHEPAEIEPEEPRAEAEKLPGEPEQPEREPEPIVESAPADEVTEPEAAPEPAVEEPPRRGFFARLFGL